MTTVAEFEEAVLSKLRDIPSVATVARYHGQLDESARATLQVPALLFAIGDWHVDSDPGTGQVDVELHCSLFVVVRNARGPEARAHGVDALCEAALPLLRLERFGLTGVGTARLERVVPHYTLEPRGLGVREIRWRQKLRLGESLWDGTGITPSKVFLGIAPDIGLGHEPDYVEVSGG